MGATLEEFEGVRELGGRVVGEFVEADGRFSTQHLIDGSEQVTLSST